MYALSMRVRVLFFGLLTDVVSRREEEVDLKEGAQISDLLGHYTREFPRLRPLLSSVAISVNREYASIARGLVTTEQELFVSHLRHHIEEPNFVIVFHLGRLPAR